MEEAFLEMLEEGLGIYERWLDVLEEDWGCWKNIVGAGRGLEMLEEDWGC